MRHTKEKKPPVEYQKVRIFHERFSTKYGVTLSIYAAFQKDDILLSEKCTCKATSLDTCRCFANYPPAPRSPFRHMSGELFRHPRPFILYTIYKESNPDIKFIFSCKTETEVLDEIKRLNLKQRNVNIWIYKEEKEYNKAALAEYRDYISLHSPSLLG